MSTIQFLCVFVPVIATAIAVAQLRGKVSLLIKTIGEKPAMALTETILAELRKVKEATNNLARRVTVRLTDLTDLLRSKDARIAALEAQIREIMDADVIEDAAMQARIDELLQQQQQHTEDDARTEAEIIAELSNIGGQLNAMNPEETPVEVPPVNQPIPPAPVDPTVPVEPEPPVQPEEPATPPVEDPTLPPVEPEPPVTPEEPTVPPTIDPEVPATPDTPVEPEAPVTPETPTTEPTEDPEVSGGVTGNSGPVGDEGVPGSTEPEATPDAAPPVSTGDEGAAGDTGNQGGEDESTPGQEDTTTTDDTTDASDDANGDSREVISESSEGVAGRRETVIRPGRTER